MTRVLRRIIRITGYALVALVAVVGLYLGAAYGLARIPVAKADPAAPADIEIFIRSNGVHSDLVLPVKTAQIDWSQQLRYDHTQSNDPAFDYVGVGWGDKGFYLDTPTWAELKASTAIRAGFWLGTTLMHATFYRTYSVLYTCNTWTNNALKVAGQKACLWTPLEAGIFYQYGQTGKPPKGVAE